MKNRKPNSKQGSQKHVFLPVCHWAELCAHCLLPDQSQGTDFRVLLLKYEYHSPFGLLCLKESKWSQKFITCVSLGPLVTLHSAWQWYPVLCYVQSASLMPLNSTAPSTWSFCSEQGRSIVQPVLSQVCSLLIHAQPCRALICMNHYHLIGNVPQAHPAYIRCLLHLDPTEIGKMSVSTSISHIRREAKTGCVTVP